MRQAGTDYPDWVKQHYLQLPKSITPRTRQLAEQITAGLDTPYDKVIAITNYLRRNIQYVETIEDEPPTNQELIDWFLFDEKKGFCNYYSTAEIVMLRSLGIPARWADRLRTGRAVGKYSHRCTHLIVTHLPDPAKKLACLAGSILPECWLGRIRANCYPARHPTAGNRSESEQHSADRMPRN